VYWLSGADACSDSGATCASLARFDKRSGSLTVLASELPGSGSTNPGGLSVGDQGIYWLQNTPDAEGGTNTSVWLYAPKPE
jgi:hypothetical protein